MNPSGWDYFTLKTMNYHVRFYFRNIPEIVINRIQNSSKSKEVYNSRSTLMGWNCIEWPDTEYGG